MKFEKLGNIASISAGQGAPQLETDFSDKGHPFIRAGHLGDLLKGENELNLPKINEEISKKYKLKLYPKGTIVFAKSGMSATKGRIYQLKNSCYLVNHLAIIGSKECVNSDFLVFALRKYSPVKLINDSSYPSISQGAIENLQIPFPSISDQLHIANILSQAENLIARRKESIRLLDEFLKSTFLEMFGDNAKMSNSKVEELGSNISYLTSGSRGWAQYYSQNGAKFLRIQNIGEGIIRTDNLIFVNPPNSAETERTRVKEGDLIISITADLGRTSVVPKNFGEAYINQHLALIRLNANINPVYAAYFYNLPFGNNAIQRKNRSAVKAGLNFNDIKSFPIVIPSFERQTQFAQIVESTEVIKAQYQSSLQELESLYGSLSQLAFKGELGAKDGEMMMAAEAKGTYQNKTNS